MHVPEPLRFTFAGFSAKRVGYTLVVLSFAFLPMHFFVSCEVSILVNGFGMMLFLATSALTALVPRGTPHRFRPLGWSFIAVIANTLCCH